jgi:hypothetical protein
VDVRERQHCGRAEPALLEEALQPGQDILVVLADEFGFTSKATFDSATAMRKEPSPQKAKAELGKRRNPFSSSPVASPSKRTKDSSSSREANDRGPEAADDQYVPTIDPRTIDQRVAQELTRTL